MSIDQTQQMPHDAMVAAGAREAIRTFPDDTSQADEREQNASWIRGLLNPLTDTERSAVDSIVHSDPETVAALATMLERKLPTFWRRTDSVDLDDYDRGYENGTRNADRDLVQGVLADLKPASEQIASALDWLSRIPSDRNLVTEAASPDVDERERDAQARGEWS